MRTSYYKYFHPKEAYITNGVLNRAVSAAAGKGVPGSIEEDANNSQYAAILFFVFTVQSFHFILLFW